MSTPTTEEVKEAFKAGAEPLNERGHYRYQGQLDAEFEDWLRGIRNDARGPCTCEPYHPGSDGPSEDCAQHGRPYAYWVEGVNVVMQRESELQNRIDRAVARLDTYYTGSELREILTGKKIPTDG